LGDPFPAMSWLPPGGPAHDIMEAGWPAQGFWHLAAHTLLLQGVLPPALLPDATFSILGPAWSLSTEWQFYALVALALAVCGSRVTTPAGLRIAVITLLLLGLLGIGNVILPTEWQFGRAFLPQEAWYFALGIASFARLRQPNDKAMRRVFSVALMSTCVTSWVGTNPASVLVPLAWMLCLACQIPTLAPAFAQTLLRQGYRLLTSPFLFWTGQISYSLYLTHAPVQRLLMLWLAPRAAGDWSAFTLAFLGPAIALPLLAALAVHHGVEEPMRRWSHRRATGSEGIRFRLPLYASGSNTSAADRP
jgi:peptidoglycan/LPS O-acetylase OafA/YrhL